MEKERLIEYFLSENARITLDRPDRIDINGLTFKNFGGIRIIQTKKGSFLELLYIGYGGKIESTQSFPIKDIKEIVLYEHFSPKYHKKEWVELYRYP